MSKLKKLLTDSIKQQNKEIDVLRELVISEIQRTDEKQTAIQ